MSSATATAKRCVNCNKDVSNDKRMKDSSGKYWCLKCGEADQMKKGQTGVPCGSCADRYPAAKLTKYGSAKLCPTCYKTATRGPKGGGFSSGGQTDKGKLIKMLVVMGVLAVIFAWRMMTLHS